MSEDIDELRRLVMRITELVVSASADPMIRKEIAEELHVISNALEAYVDSSSANETDG